LLIDVRNQGQIILQNFELFKDFIHFPIIEPAVNYVLSGATEIDRVFFITTDQPDADDFYKNKDTLFLGQIAEKYLKARYGQKIKNPYQIKISGNLTYYDEMYELITDKLNGGEFKFNENDYKVYLLAQGGIDAINTALLLKSIEKFPNFNQLHKPENKNDVDILSFPDKFKTNINIHIIKNAIKNYNYSLVIENFPSLNSTLTGLCNYAHSRLNLDYKSAFNHCENLLNIGILNKNMILNILQKEVRLIDAINYNLQKQRDLYLSAKIKFKQLQFGDFLMKIFTLSENILKPYILSYGFDISYEEKTEPRHKKWNNSFNYIDNKEQNKLSKYLASHKLKGGIRFDFPGKYAYYGIYEYYYLKDNNLELKKFLEICRSIFVLADLRNTIAHQLESVTKEMINKELNAIEKINLDDFITQLDLYFGLKNENDFGIYDEINKKIISLL